MNYDEFFAHADALVGAAILKYGDRWSSIEPINIEIFLAMRQDPNPFDTVEEFFWNATDLSDQILRMEYGSQTGTGC